MADLGAQLLAQLDSLGLNPGQVSIDVDPGRALNTGSKRPRQDGTLEDTRSGKAIRSGTPFDASYVAELDRRHAILEQNPDYRFLTKLAGVIGVDAFELLATEDLRRVEFIERQIQQTLQAQRDRILQDIDKKKATLQEVDVILKNAQDAADRLRAMFLHWGRLVQRWEWLLTPTGFRGNDMLHPLPYGLLCQMRQQYDAALFGAADLLPVITEMGRDRQYWSTERNSWWRVVHDRFMETTARLRATAAPKNMQLVMGIMLYLRDVMLAPYVTLRPSPSLFTSGPDGMANDAVKQRPVHWIREIMAAYNDHIATYADDSALAAVLRKSVSYEPFPDLSEGTVDARAPDLKPLLTAAEAYGTKIDVSWKWVGAWSTLPGVDKVGIADAPTMGEVLRFLDTLGPNLRKQLFTYRRALDAQTRGSQGPGAYVEFSTRPVSAKYDTDYKPALADLDKAFHVFSPDYEPAASSTVVWRLVKHKEQGQLELTRHFNNVEGVKLYTLGFLLTCRSKGWCWDEDMLYTRVLRPLFEGKVDDKKAIATSADRHKALQLVWQYLWGVFWLRHIEWLFETVLVSTLDDAIIDDWLKTFVKNHHAALSSVCGRTYGNGLDLAIDELLWSTFEEYPADGGQGVPPPNGENYFADTTPWLAPFLPAYIGTPNAPMRTAPPSVIKNHANLSMSVATPENEDGIVAVQRAAALVYDKTGRAWTPVSFQTVMWQHLTRDLPGYATLLRQHLPDETTFLHPFFYFLWHATVFVRFYYDAHMKTLEDAIDHAHLAMDAADREITAMAASDLDFVTPNVLKLVHSLYTPTAAWQLQVMMTGKLRLAPFVVTALARAHSDVQKYMPAWKDVPCDLLTGNAEAQSVPKGSRVDPELATDFAVLVGNYVNRARLMFPTQYNKDKQYTLSPVEFKAACEALRAYRVRRAGAAWIIEKAPQARR